LLFPPEELPAPIDTGLPLNAVNAFDPDDADPPPIAVCFELKTG